MQRLRIGPLRPPRSLSPWNVHARTFVSDVATSHETRRRRRPRRKSSVKRLPRTTPLKVYEVSDLVLDLDAENCPHVRAYNDEDAKEQLEHWSSAPHVDALVQRVASFREELRMNNKLWARRLEAFDPRRISSRDVLAAALLGPPCKPAEEPQGAAVSRESTQAENVITNDERIGSLTSTILKTIGVSERMASDRIRIVSVLLRRLEVQDPQTTNENMVGLLKQQIKGGSLRDVKRIITPLLGTDAGCALVSRCGPEIIHVCTRDSQLRDGAYSLQVVSMLKNIAINLATRGISRDGFAISSGPELQAILDGWQSSEAKRPASQ